MIKYPIWQPYFDNRETEYLLKTMESGWISSMGENLRKFEEIFAEYCNTEFSVLCCNGTVALHLALVVSGVGPGDEVIVPSFTFIATANAVKYTGATVKFADIDKTTLCIDPESVRRLITPKTKAIIPVHIYGHPADMRKLSKIAKANRIKLIEDAAEAHGAEIEGRRVGSFGDMGVFSFYGNKIITSGEGGIITCKSKKTYRKLCFLRDHAMSPIRRYWHPAVGFNYRMTNIQAAILLAQMTKIDEITFKKRQIFEWYKEFLGNYTTIELNNTTPGYKNVFWLICVRIKKLTQKDRIKLMDMLKSRGVDSRPFFYPINIMPIYKNADPTPVANSIYKSGINLPSYFNLTRDDVKYISDVLLESIQLLGK